MRSNVTDLGVPATRQVSARIVDIRLWGGLGLLAGSAALGALLLTRGADTVPVWRATHDLSAGALPSGLERVEVARALVGDRYAAPGDPVDAPLRWPIRAGELVPTSAVGAVDRDGRLVTVPVDPLHAPVGLAAGDVVDVWATASADSATAQAALPRLVRPAAVVTGVSEDGLGVGGQLAVVLAVPQAEVSAIVAAAHAGSVDLVAVPAAGQEALP